jgi:ribosomal protein L11 methyltransferase
MRVFPAIEFRWPSLPAADATDLLIAALDEFALTAVDEQADGSVRVYFSDVTERDRALAFIGRSPNAPAAASLMVPDEAWAERSQAALQPIRAGRIVVAPPWSASPPAGPDDVVIVIQPSMGFGTGHHASTRLCLRLLQQQAVAGRSMLDVGTGSGVLALAAWRLGARPIVAIDFDSDALESAADNVARNGAGGAVALRRHDLVAEPLPQRFDVVTANLTGDLIARAAATLAACVATGGVLVVSGILATEWPPVLHAVAAAGFRLESQIDEDEWVGAALRPRRPLGLTGC